MPGEAFIEQDSNVDMEKAHDLELRLADLKMQLADLEARRNDREARIERDRLDIMETV